MRKIFYIVMAAAVIVIGFYAFNAYIYNEKQGESQVATSHLDALYIIDGNLVRLKNGTNESESLVTRYFGNEVKTDLDGDGVEDIAFLVTQSSGGDEIRYYVVGALNTKDGYVGSQALYLGDRIAPQTTAKGTGKIVVVNYADRKAGEGFEIDPSQGKSIWLLLDPESMQWGEVAQNFEGEADPAKMTLGMKAWAWNGTKLIDGAMVVPKDLKKFTVTFGAANAFTATTDCNSMGGTYITDGSTITLSNMYMTKMFCQDSQEGDFSKTLSDAQSYSFTSKGELIFELKNGGSATFK